MRKIPQAVTDDCINSAFGLYTVLNQLQAIVCLDLPWTVSRHLMIIAAITCLW